MFKNKKLWFLVIPIVLLIALMLKDSFSQKSIGDLPGDFKEVAFVRNEQNKGGIIRIYAVTVGDITQANFDEAAKLFPTNDYGSSTTIYFFDKNKDFPTTLSIENPHFDGQKYSPISISKTTGVKKD